MSVQTNLTSDMAIERTIGYLRGTQFKVSCPVSINPGTHPGVYTYLGFGKNNRIIKKREMQRVTEIFQSYVDKEIVRLKHGETED